MAATAFAADALPMKETAVIGGCWQAARAMACVGGSRTGVAAASLADRRCENHHTPITPNRHSARPRSSETKMTDGRRHPPGDAASYSVGSGGS